MWPDEDTHTIDADDLLGSYPVLRYGPPDEEVYVDLICRLGELVRYEDLESSEREVQGVLVSVATARTLYTMKRHTLRPVDQEDAARLQRAFGF